MSVRISYCGGQSFILIMPMFGFVSVSHSRLAVQTQKKTNAFQFVIIARSQINMHARYCASGQYAFVDGHIGLICLRVYAETCMRMTGRSFQQAKKTLHIEHVSSYGRRFEIHNTHVNEIKPI